MARNDNYGDPSTPNTSTTALGSGATFTGTFEQSDYPDVMVSCEADTDGVIYIDFSNDGTNYNSEPESGFIYEAGSNFLKVLSKGPRYCRVRFVNSATPQTYLRLHTYLGVFWSDLSDSGQLQSDLSINSVDAWGKPKVVNDKSIFHGMFTEDVPVAMWHEHINDVEQTSFTYATSENGKLKLVSNGTLNDQVRLSTFRRPRYEPNRGHWYSLSAFLPSPTALGERLWGVFTPESGVFFKLKSGGALYAVIRTTVSAVTTDTEYLIDTSILGASFDLSKGNLFDIKFQWRGVGDYYFYINMKLVKHVKYVGTLDELSMFNPANPVSYECVNKGADVTIFSGCVDVTSEGGEVNGKTYGSISIDNQTGQVAIPNTGGLYNIPILIVRSKETVNSRINTRDTLALLATAYADQRSFFRVWATRDATAITLNDQSWADFGDGHLEYIQYQNPTVTTPVAFDTAKAKLIFGTRVDQDQSYSTSALFEGRADIYQTPGDIFVFTIHRETGASVNCGVTYEFAEEI